MIRAGHNIVGATVTILGLTFKEDCPDLRNSKVIDIIRELQDYGINLQICDPLADPEEALHEYGVELTPLAAVKPAHAVVAAVAHKEYRELTSAQLFGLMLDAPVLVDVKGMFDCHSAEQAGIRLWRL